MITEIISKIRKPYWYVGELASVGELERLDGDNPPEEFTRALDEIERFTDRRPQSSPELYERRFRFFDPENVSLDIIDVAGYSWKSNSVIINSEYIENFPIHVHELSHALQIQEVGWNKYLSRWDDRGILSSYPFQKMESEGFAYWMMNKVGGHDQIEEKASEEEYNAFQKFIAHEEESGVQETVERALNPQSQPVIDRHNTL